MPVDRSHMQSQIGALAYSPSRRATAATYALVQQLLPGVEQDPTRLEMGRRYEEVDSGAVDRERGAAATDREKAVAEGAAEGMKS